MASAKSPSVTLLCVIESRDRMVTVGSSSVVEAEESES
jgi:hypothetical protein